MTIEIKEFTPKALHFQMQEMRQVGKEVTLKDYLPRVFGEDISPEKYYAQLGVNLAEMSVQKLLATDEDTRWLFPEILRDAIKKGMMHAPFYSQLITGEETIQNTGMTMPWFNPSAAALRDTNEGADITTGTMSWDSKQVTINKKARGLMQTYESIMFTPVSLAAIYFEDLGVQLGADLDSEALDVLINGDQDDGSEAAVIMGIKSTGNLEYSDIVRSWVRQNRMHRPSQIMIMNEAMAVEVLNMAAFQIPVRNNGSPLVELDLQSALPSSQKVLVHSDVPDGQIILLDPTKAMIQLTAMKLLIESETVVNKQLIGKYVSLITGFANIFADARIILDVSKDIASHPGPTPQFG